MKVPMPHPAMSDEGKIKYATEVSYNILVNQAHNMGLPVQPNTGLESLGNAVVQLQWEDACRAVLEALRPDPEATSNLEVATPDPPPAAS